MIEDEELLYDGRVLNIPADLWTEEEFPFDDRSVRWLARVAEGLPDPRKEYVCEWDWHWHWCLGPYPHNREIALFAAVQGDEEYALVQGYRASYAYDSPFRLICFVEVDPDEWHGEVWHLEEQSDLVHRCPLADVIAIPEPDRHTPNGVRDRLCRCWRRIRR